MEDSFENRLMLDDTTDTDESETDAIGEHNDDTDESETDAIGEHNEEGDDDPFQRRKRAKTFALTNDNFDMAKMRELIAHWVLMNEHPFTIVEEEGFNLIRSFGTPKWEKISCHTNKNDCVKVYEMEKNKLKTLLRNVSKISLTIDFWNSSDQMIEYMVLTGHFVDSNLRLKKRVLNFVHIPRPRHGVQIADSIYECLKEWEIENKVYTISVDNASTNDVAIVILKEKFSINRKLLCEGKLFHVWCYAHILNLMVQDGLSQIKYIIEEIYDSVSYINQPESTLISFSEIVQQLQLPYWKLILDCSTRWDSTYEMLATALKFKEVFLRFKERDPHYNYCPNLEDWEKVEKVCEILKVFSSATNIISRSDYPTSNLFLNEVCWVKVLLDKKSQDENEFIRDMVKKMKDKFDKYWGECNLLMAIAAVLDPRCKMKVIDFWFPKMYPEHEARENIIRVRETLYELYREYVAEHQSSSNDHSVQTEVVGEVNVENESAGWLEFVQFLRVQKSELDCYLEEGCYRCTGDPYAFDALEWWTTNILEYPILSTMARDILAIPITTVASDDTFSAGSRVINTYQTSLSPEIVQVLLCGGDWCRNNKGVKKMKKEEGKGMEIMLPIPSCDGILETGERVQMDSVDRVQETGEESANGLC